MDIGLINERSGLMASISLTLNDIKQAKNALISSLPGIPSSHLSEALAAAIGERTHASLLSRINNGTDNPEITFLKDEQFVLRLQKLGYQIRWPGFDGIKSKSIIITNPPGADKLFYNSARNKAWRNMLVAGINAGVEQNLFSVRAGDNRWPGYSPNQNTNPSYTYEFFFQKSIPAIANVRDIGWDELSIHVALWPTERAKEFIQAGFSKFHSGKASAEGWLERKTGAWLQKSNGRPIFSCRKDKLPLIANANITPLGFGDRGKSFM
jgi:hypothetical protein